MMKNELVKMPNKYYKQLLDICSVQSHYSNEKLMTLFLVDKLSELGLSFNIDAIGNILVTKGESELYPCIVAHMDTVHTFVDNYNLYYYIDKKVEHKILFAKSNDKPTGIGGDDKCGIFACLYMLQQFDNIKVVFFTQEECGLKGSKNITHDFFDDCMYILQLDRRYGSDFIDNTYDGKTISKDFSSQIGHIKKAFGFKSARGTITDCIKLWENNIGISCANISSGYYKPHSNNEYIDTEELWNSTLFTRSIIETLKSKRYLSKPSPPKVSKFQGYSKTSKKCMICNTTDNYLIEMISVGTKYVCSKCMLSILTVKDAKCNKCNKPISLTKQEGLVTWLDTFLSESNPYYTILCNECYSIELADYKIYTKQCNICKQSFSYRDLDWNNGDWTCFHCWSKKFEPDEKSKNIISDVKICSECCLALDVEEFNGDSTVCKECEKKDITKRKTERGIALLNREPIYESSGRNGDTPLEPKSVLLPCDLCNIYKPEKNGKKFIEGCSFVCGDCLESMESILGNACNDNNDSIKTIEEFKNNDTSDKDDTDNTIENLP